jgi:hypothetical protein
MVFSLEISPLFIIKPTMNILKFSQAPKNPSKDNKVTADMYLKSPLHVYNYQTIFIKITVFWNVVPCSLLKDH